MKNNQKDFFKNEELYSFLPENDFLMKAAKDAASSYSLTPNYPIGILAAIQGRILCVAGDGNGYHEANVSSEGHINGCRRVFISQERIKNGGEKIKPGEEFDLCFGCHTDFHAEANLIKKAAGANISLQDADVYMYGHYWCCGDCWEKMKNAGIRKVFLPDTYKKFENIDEVRKWAKECEEKRKLSEVI